MTIFDIQPGRIIGDIKDQIKEAILDGQIKNDRHEAYTLMLKIASEKGIYLKINTP
jgi:hypothetical protein